MENQSNIYPLCVNSRLSDCSSLSQQCVLKLPVAGCSTTGRSWPGAAFGDRFRIADLGGTCVFSIGRFRKTLGTSAPGQKRKFSLYILSPSHCLHFASTIIK